MVCGLSFWDPLRISPVKFLKLFMLLRASGWNWLLQFLRETHRARTNLSYMRRASSPGQGEKKNNLGFSLSSAINSKVILSTSFNLRGRPFHQSVKWEAGVRWPFSTPSALTIYKSLTQFISSFQQAWHSAAWQSNEKQSFRIKVCVLDLSVGISDLFQLFTPCFLSPEADL